LYFNEELGIGIFGRDWLWKLS